MKSVCSLLCTLVGLLAASSCKRSEPVSECGAALEPAAEHWAERSDSELSANIERAMQCGRSRQTRVLLEFTAPWCADCREMARIEAEEPASSVIASRFERVRVNVKRWDAHRALIERFGIHAIAAYVVLDPRTGAVLAQTTREPMCWLLRTPAGR